MNPPDRATLWPWHRQGEVVRLAPNVLIGVIGAGMLHKREG
jgi:hypothetical protein